MIDTKEIEVVLTRNAMTKKILLACLWVTGSVLNASAADHPHILWLTSEDHGPEMGCYGDALAVTPNVDGLARKGMLFDLAWSCAPVCAPARTCIITGMYPPSIGGQHMRSMVSLPDEMQFYPWYLKKAGYYTSNNSKQDYNVNKMEQGWDASSKKAHYRDRAEDQPFFAVFNVTVSHESKIRKRPHAPTLDPAKIRVPAYHPDNAESRQDWAQYYDIVSQADAMAGQRLAELARAGLTDDTIVFYYGDHGSGMARSKRWPYNSGLSVPMVVYFPEKWKHLAKWYGMVKTSIGPASETELIRDNQNNIASTLEAYLFSYGMTDEIKIALDEFESWLRSSLILTKNIIPHNVVLGYEGEKIVLKIIDGLGSKSYLPLTQVSDLFAKKYVERRIELMRSRINWDLTGRQGDWK